MLKAAVLSRKCHVVKKMRRMMMSKAAVIGGGFAGVECASQLAKRGIDVDLFEMKPTKYSPAHKSANLCELVCSNSFKAMRVESASGLLKAEMKLLGSVCVECAEESAVPAGGALAVDRDIFASLVTEKIENNERINVIRKEITEIPTGYDAVVIAAGPLVSDALAESIKGLTGSAFLSFFDAAAPVIEADSVDMDKAFLQSRYDRGGEDDYINCPMNKEEYEAFYEALVNAEIAELHEFDKKHVYEGCMPVEIMAKRGPDTIRFGPLKPVGLRDPKTGHRPWAVLQLRKENKEGTMYNLVGFQTNLKFPEQKRVFSMIPALHDAEFVRFGVMHRNTFLDSPRLLNGDFSMKKHPEIFFAGQITGVEGYMESAAAGIMAGINAARRILGKDTVVLPPENMIGALSRYISDGFVTNFQPMGASFGLLPQLPEKIRDKKERYGALAKRSLEMLGNMIID
ncbi:MAG: methylenetetrahydrofolate--tRNA-(uracil(54)-C(5))-methyltransferase (FADH(2)-oxidizing) TrmFO [Clostridia bacterium]|nr:methylenetetrahydrofolate--tRNA-(uracil(54)-C(5))-methyltransferase (FADH(2)-oxidizing) TrmFO [Clostridia bacterium]